MSLKFRRFLFYALFLFFSLASFGTIMYANGWRIDFGILSVRKTGGLYIETAPKDAVIEVNNEQFPNRSSLIKSGTLITNLLSKIYQVEISREGYFPYHKNILVKPFLVTELINVILIPKKIEKTMLVSQKIKGDKIVDFNENSQRFIVKNKNEIYYFYNLNNLLAALNINASLNNIYKNNLGTENIRKAVFHPFDSNRLIIEANGLYILDFYRGKSEHILKNTKNSRLIAWSAENSIIYYVKQIMGNRYSLFSFNLMTKKENVVFEFSNAEMGEIIEIAAADFGDNIAIINNLGDIYVFNVVDKSFQKISHDAKIFSFSPDSGKIAFVDNGGKLNIYFLKNQFKNNFVKSGETIGFDLENKELIEDIYWHKDSNHLFIKKSDKTVFFTEIDNRPPLNQHLIIGDIENFYYNRKSDASYFIQNMMLYGINL